MLDNHPPSTTHTPWIRTIVLALLSIGFIGALIYYIVANAERFADLFQISYQAVVSIWILSLLSPVIRGVMNTLQFRVLGVNISHQDGFHLAAATTLANQLPISGGILTKGLYLKKKYNLAFTRFASSTIATFICFLAANGIIGLSVHCTTAFINSSKPSLLLVTGFSAMTASLLVFWLPFDRVRLPGKLNKWILQALDGWLLISRNPKLLFQLIGLQTILMVSTAFRYSLAFQMMSQEVKLADVILMSAATMLTQIVSIAPGGLGVREAIVGIIASALGFNFGTSVVAISLDRLIVFTNILVVGGFSAVVLGGKIPTIEEEMGSNKQ